MSTAAQIAANIANAQAATGPRTAAGKATSSKNSITHGLFAGDFIRPGEQPEYSTLYLQIDLELNPTGLLEKNLVDEMLRAMWRLRRCAQLEAGFVDSLSNGVDPIPDPMQNEATARLQNSVDRARAQAHRLLHRCTAELRKLPTEQQYRTEFFRPGTDNSRLGICDFRAVMKGLDEYKSADLRQRKLEGLDDIVSIMETTHNQMAKMPVRPTEVPVTQRTQSVPRNAQCPCNSGQKHKRCCGKNVPPILQTAA